MHFVITGAAGALGRNLAEVLAQAGHSLSGIDIADGLDSIRELTTGFGGVDLGDAAAVEKAVQAAVDTNGPIDGLANIAGGFTWQTIAEGDAETWDRMYTINVRTALNACRAAIPRLADRASIVNIGAGAALKAGPGMGAYAASKSAVHRLTEALAEELRDREIRVNAILPSIIDTAANRRDMPDADFSKWVTPTEISNVIAFLLSPDSTGVTGTLVPVPGRV